MTRGEELFGSVFENERVVIRQGDPGNVMYVIPSGTEAMTPQQGRHRKMNVGV